MALTRAQLLSGNQAQGTVLSGQVQGVKQGAGIAIATDGTISVNSATVTGLVKLNNTGAFNGYVWPATDGASGEFLKTNGAGVLAWATTQGFAVVTVSPLPPSPVDEGELWYDCSTGTLKVYQNCTTPNGWTSTAQAGLNPQPGNTSALPAFSSGNGTQGTPYVSSVTTVGSGGSTFVVNVVTITGLAAFQYVPIVDLNAVANGGRFGFSNYYANAAGTLIFQTIFNDAPASPSGTNYTANIKVGNASVYVTAVVNVVSALTLNSPGSISGLPNVGVTLTYTTGTASGGSSPYTYTWKWKDSTGAVLQNNGATYAVVIGNLGKTITVELTATDAALQTATGTTTPTAAVTKASFPSGTWNPTPSGAMNTSNPGTSSGTWNGPAGTVITATGCVEVSKDGISYFPTVTVTSPDVLYQRWKDTAGCGQANTGSPLTGTVSDGTSENSYSLTINRQPSPAIADISDTNIALNATTTKGIASPVAGLNSPAYITLGAGSTGTGIQVSTDNVTFVTPPAAPSTSVTIANAQTLYIRQTVGAVTNTGYTAVIKIGDADGVIADTVTYTATTVTSAVFPATTFAPAGGPNASPANTLVGSLDGTSTATWGAGATNLTATGSLEFQVNGGGFTQASTAVANTNTVELRWNAAAATAAADAGTLTGTLTNGTYTNTYTLTVDKQPAAYTWTDQTSIATSTQVTSNVITITGINCPAELTYTPDGTNPLTAVQAAINGGAFTNIPTTGTGLTINPADTAGTAATTIQIRGTTGASNNTPYKITTNIGKGAAVVSDEWSVTTTAAVASITTPSISSPANGTTNLKPTITLVGSTYLPLNGAGTPQTSSTWEVYKWIGGASPTAPTTEPPAPASYTAITGSPFTVSSAPFTSKALPSASLTTSSTYYGRVKYATTNTTAATSSFSGWSSFGTASTFDVSSWTPTSPAVTFNAADYSSDQSLGLAVGGTSSLTSTDGISWTVGGSMTGASTAQSVAYAKIGATSTWIAGASTVTTAEFYRSTDNGVTWTSVTVISDGSTLQPRVVWNPNSNLFMATNGNNPVKTSPDGVTWTAKGAPGTGSNQHSALAYIGTTWFSSDLEGYLYKSSNNGTSWTSVAGPWSQPTHGSGFSDAMFAAGSTLYYLVAGNASTCYKSTDLGATWTTITNPAVGGTYYGYTGCGAYNGNVILVTGSVGIKQSVDGGTTWTQGGGTTYTLNQNTSLAGLFGTQFLSVFQENSYNIAISA